MLEPIAGREGHEEFEGEELGLLGAPGGGVGGFILSGCGTIISSSETSPESALYLVAVPGRVFVGERERVRVDGAVVNDSSSAASYTNQLSD
jgi:hypothetical protein